MALGKNARPGKRSASSSSYLSTITTVGFVALCVFGVWMLTSSSVVPSQRSGDAAGSDSGNSLSSASRLGKPTQGYEQTDLAEEQDRMISALGRRAGGSGKAYDDGAGDESAGKEEEKQEPAAEEEESRRGASGGEEEEKPRESGGDDGGREQGRKEDRGAESAEAGEGNERAQERTDVGERQQQVEDNVENKQSETSEENQQQPETSEENQQQQTEGNDENQQQLQAEVNEEKRETQSINAEDEIDQTRERPEQLQESSDSGKSDEVQQEGQAEEQQHEQEQLPQRQEQEQQQQEEEAENREQQQQYNAQNVESGSAEQQHQQQPNSESSNKTQQQAETGEPEHQQATAVEGNGENNQQQPQPRLEEEQAQEHTVESSSVENQEQPQQKDDGNASGSNSQQSDDRLADPHVGDSISKETKRQQHGSAWSTQAGKSETENERQESLSSAAGGSEAYGYSWGLCNVTAGPDYIPCLDNEKALKQLRSTRHYEHRERHCPEESPTCLVPLPQGYKQPIEWPKSRDSIWYSNVPHTKLAEVKGHQNWVKVAGEYLSFPGGGTQFIHGALHYIDFIQQAVPKIAWGKRTRVILDVGCGVASFGGYLFERDVLAMSFAPKDEHEAQVQFALERGIPAISTVMGSKRLSFPSRVFDIVHCARCRVPWHAEGGILLLELNRVLRPGGFFVWSATPVYQKLKEDVQIWNAMKSLTASMCWELVTIKKDKLNSVGAAIYRKPTSNECYNTRKVNEPPMCKEDDDANAAWYVPLQACMHKVPVDAAVRGSRWPKEWPLRLQKPPYWLNNTQVGVYGKSAPADFVADYEHWKRVVSKSYLSGLGISWSNVRNVMDMRAVYGGFAAALNDLKVWVMNVVNVDSPDTLPIIYERGLFGIYHDWCESFSTYPRSYDLLHADHLFSNLKKRCKLMPVMTEIDRIVRPGGKIIVRDKAKVVGEVENLLKSLHWDVRLTFSKDRVGILSAQKTDWRPDTYSDS